MSVGIHHALKRKKTENKNTRLIKFVDKLIYLLTAIGVVGNIPQLYKIWFEGNTSGVSLLTWLGFLGGSLFWFFYGILHKEKPIIFGNLCLAIIQICIVIGLIYK